MSALNRSLNRGRRVRNDEFYTRYEDIDRELGHYRDHFRDRAIYCNCDIPHVSAFHGWFRMNFRELRMRRLTVSCFSDGIMGGLLPASDDPSSPARWWEYDGECETAGEFRGNGDFRSDECIELLKRSDIVVTNPPFSLFREYVSQLMEYGKKFLILGNFNAAHYREIFPLIRDNRIWLGVSPRGMDFIVPGDDGGAAGTAAVNAVWYTNLPHERRNGRLPMGRRYNPRDYPRYDNYDAIEVARSENIPGDWPGVMGVPFTFLDRYNPEQFEILGMTGRIDDIGLKTRIYTARDAPNWNDLNASCILRENGSYRIKYVRLLIRNRNPGDSP